MSGGRIGATTIGRFTIAVVVDDVVVVVVLEVAVVVVVVSVNGSNAARADAPANPRAIAAHKTTFFIRTPSRIQTAKQLSLSAAAIAATLAAATGRDRGHRCENQGSG